MPWATSAAAACVKGKREFHRYVMNVLVQNVAQLKVDVQSGNMSAFKPCAKVARWVVHFLFYFNGIKLSSWHVSLLLIVFIQPHCLQENL